MARSIRIQNFGLSRLSAVVAGGLSLVMLFFNASANANAAAPLKAASVKSSPEQIREIKKLLPAGPNSVCRDLKIEAQETSGKWLCLNLDFVSPTEQLSTLQILQSSLEVAQKNDATSTYFYRMTGVRHHGFRVKSVKLVKTAN